MRKFIFWLALAILPIFASSEVHVELELKRAIEILKEENLEVDIAKFNEMIREQEYRLSKSYRYGKLDFIQNIVYSSDAGDIFGFKLQSREATFGDFGFSQFDNTKPNILSVRPRDLNHPDPRAHFQTKLRYELPIYAGGKLEQYTKITKALQKLSALETQKVICQKIYQLKKSYYDIYLLDSYIYNLDTVSDNMQRLETIAQNMVDEGYAKKIDILEVQSKKANVTRMINKAEANRELAYHFISFLLNAKIESISIDMQDIELKQYSADIVLQNSLDIKKAKKGLEISKMAIEMQRASSLPIVGAFAEYSSSDDMLLERFMEHDAYTLGVQLKWNLFDSGASSNSLQKAKVESLKAKKQLDLAQKGVALKVQKIATQIKSYSFDIDSLKKEIELARAIYKNYLGRYQEKLISINDVIIKQSLEIERVLKLNEVQNSKIDKILELEKIVNKEEI